MIANKHMGGNNNNHNGGSTGVVRVSTSTTITITTTRKRGKAVVNQSEDKTEWNRTTNKKQELMFAQ